ncbi:hypothetical protein N5C72_00435 [Achromobacter mucicolens]|uniref:Uncharacterized protein n=1 Tax=Achromobacter mucicolens TaxID=1389922 RepID=A0ABD4YMQ3_9BURK|nr:hypothetical protein [Achromobacter mucicolens]MDH1176516.1 hypothetical protein [Achromobacter mucicolens]
MTQSKSGSARDSIPGQPDVNAGALRPSGPATTSERVPDIDHPPSARSHDQPGFDQAVAQEEAEARSGAPTGGSGNRPAPSGEEEPQ